MTLRNIALVTFHDPRGRGGSLEFTENDGTFSVKSAMHRNYGATVWRAVNGKVMPRTASEGVSLSALLRAASDATFGALTWCSPHAFSVLGRILHWERMQYSLPAQETRSLTVGGILDVVDLFYTPDSQRSTLTREEREKCGLVDMCTILPSLALGPLTSAESQATFLLRLCYAASGMTIDF